MPAGPKPHPQHRRPLGRCADGPHEPRAPPRTSHGHLARRRPDSTGKGDPARTLALEPARGGALETGETVEEGLRCELREETGLEVQVDELLYVTDRFKSLGHHVVDLCFRIHRIAGTPSEQAVGEDGEILSEVRMVALDDLPAFGLSEKFVRLVRDGFPGKGSYGGEFHALYG